MQILHRIFKIIITLFVPIILILASVRILLTPLFIQVEYHLPGFPGDPYGFSLDDRLYWANISRTYLMNREGIEYLQDQRLDEDTPLYNERELRHMLDVKNVVRGAMWVMTLSLIMVIISGFCMARNGDFNVFGEAVSWGGWLTVGLIVSVLIYLGLNFSSMFTNFHKIFFEGDTWLFRYSDTLIRLFPIKFWRDAFIWIAVMSLLGGLLLGWFFPRNKH